MVCSYNTLVRHGHNFRPAIVVRLISEVYSVDMIGYFLTVEALWFWARGHLSADLFPNWLRAVAFSIGFGVAVLIPTTYRVRALRLTQINAFRAKWWLRELSRSMAYSSRPSGHPWGNN